MPKRLLACVPGCSDELDLVELNRVYRWSSVRKLKLTQIEVAGRYQPRDVYLIGDSHGVYNGCLGPPPAILNRRGKNRKEASAKQNAELYIAGTRLGREEVSVFLKLFCAGGGCLFAFIESEDTADREIRSAAKHANSISVGDATSEWPCLITDERPQLAVVSSDAATNA